MHVEHAYDVSPGELLEVLTDEAFLVARSARFGGDGEPRVERGRDRIVVSVPRRLPVEAVPGPLRRFVGTGELVQTDTWSPVGPNGVTGTWTAETGDSPLDLHGTHEITGTDGGCRYVLTALIKVSIRFVGGQAESLVSSRLRELISKEQQFAADWLTGKS